MEQTLPIIELKEDELGNLKDVKNSKNMIAKILHNEDTELYSDDIAKFMENDDSAEIWKKRSPKRLSENMAIYQEYNVDYDKNELNKEIREIGFIIPTGQYLYHGGFFHLEEGNIISLDRPFATSLYPGEAIFHSQIAGKAYDNDKIVLLSLLVDDSITKAVTLFQKDGLLSHEHEVLFASGLNLEVDSKTKIYENFKVKNVDETKEKEVPVYILMCRIS